MPNRTGLLPAATAALVLTALLTGCGSGGGPTAPAPTGSLSAGFLGQASPPAPEATIQPAAGSWDGVHPPKGYRVVLLTEGEDAGTTALRDAVTDWADREGVDVQRVVVTDPSLAIDKIVFAMSSKPDLVIAAGGSLVDPLALVTASHLDRQFLVLGAQLPEPTYNVTATVWDGASSRGSEIAGESGTVTVTPERAQEAVEAGVASVVNDLTGIVIWLS
ncbi:hypothetical protein [Naasia aerilata]|uniref:BMP family ABC transporter substrate-binding protein n=1 Tax=Naasia aerilata TaxID=1162966 RepID=A0ABN6XR32_9MICO|nr:hypothetical protein [Naasia aerilata]BDZ47455.1 hypothetical protein GCM10025866_33640 [Naasia aerilata]